MTDIPPEALQEIIKRLESIRAEDGIRFLLAIESGSRAWGFPSPDSDYDVRFIYVRPWQEYVTLRPVRDVIERPIVDDFDINGWDIRKALGLLLNHNAVVAEWLNSPIRYVPDDPIVARLGEVADHFFDPAGYAMHYASLGKNNAARWDMTAETIPVKRYFYTLRPALSVRALRLDPDRRPPMRLQELVKVSDLSKGMAADIDRMIEFKSRKREAALTARFPEIEKLVFDELDRAHEVPSRRRDEDFVAAVDVIFRDVIAS